MGTMGYWNNIYQKSLRSPEGIMSKMPLILSLNINALSKKGSDKLQYHTKIYIKKIFDQLALLV
jgi:hypothetical protein